MIGLWITTALLVGLFMFFYLCNLWADRQATTKDPAHPWPPKPTTPPRPYIERWAEAMFGDLVYDVWVDWHNTKVVPLTYYRPRMLRSGTIELDFYSPVVHWKVKGREPEEFYYVFEPLQDRRTYQVELGHEGERLLAIMQMAVDGHSVEEINRHFARRPQPSFPSEYRSFRQHMSYK